MGLRSYLEEAEVVLAKYDSSTNLSNGAREKLKLSVKSLKLLSITTSAQA
jgi:hypothetical protein